MNVHSLSNPLPLSGEHRLPACRIRQLAECIFAPECGLAVLVRGKLPRTTGRRPVLPRSLSALPITARVRLVRQILNLSWFGDQYCRQLVLLMGKLKNRNHDAQDQERVNDCFHYPPALFLRADQEPICRLSFVIHSFTTKTLPCSDFV